jgi:glycopeptide antibiotics resistance protein
MKKTIVKIVLIIYLIALIKVTFFDRNIYYLENDSFLNYARLTVNLVPFRFISDFIYQFQIGMISKVILVRQIVANFILLMPLSILLPMLNNKFYQIRKMAISIIGASFMIEIMQLITRRGFFDIDDLILNISGALLCYYICKKIQHKYKQRDYDK